MHEWTKCLVYSILPFSLSLVSVHFPVARFVLKAALTTHTSKYLINISPPESNPALDRFSGRLRSRFNIKNRVRMHFRGCFRKINADMFLMKINK